MIKLDSKMLFASHPKYKDNKVKIEYLTVNSKNINDLHCNVYFSVTIEPSDPIFTSYIYGADILALFFIFCREYDLLEKYVPMRLYRGSLRYGSTHVFNIIADSSTNNNIRMIANEIVISNSRCQMQLNEPQKDLLIMLLVKYSKIVLGFENVLKIHNVLSNLPIPSDINTHIKSLLAIEIVDKFYLISQRAYLYCN